MEIKTICLLWMLSMGVCLSQTEFLPREKRNWIIQTFPIDENYSGVFPYYLDKVDIDSAFNILEITGQGMNEEPRGLIEINQKSGHILVLGPVDYEAYQILRLKITAQGKDNRTWIKVGINFEIIDTNDNSPIFGKNAYETTINESTLQGTEVINVTATDNDITEENNMFFFSVDAVLPKQNDLEFFINKVPYFGNGTISFKGCLDSKKANQYTLIVKATDHGKPEPLYSFTTVTINIEHGNRFRPVIVNQTGHVIVKEGVENFTFSRLQVKDEDTRGTKGWNAIYKIQGDDKNYFEIRTDPQTNEGLLYVKKQLDYEKESLKNITITVENEIPYFTCKVTDRNTTGLWKIKTDSSSLFSGASSGSGIGGSGTLQTKRVTVIIDDINEPPVFDPLNPVSVFENAEVGHYLGRFTARDPDVYKNNIIRYIKGEDPANVVTVEAKTGKITTSSMLDRESPFAKDGIYVITIKAVDNGSPPLTGTASLSIFIINENDNAPSLIVSTFDMCQNDKSSRVNVTAVDPDEAPYSGPFSFKLLGDVGRKWRVEPELGFSVNLVKGENVYYGHYTLMLEVSDFQGKKAFHNLSVTLCKCNDPANPDCRLKRATGSRVGIEALGILFFCITLLIGMLFLTFLVSCKTQKIIIRDDEPVQKLMTSSTEEPGTDCQVPFHLLVNGHNRQQTQFSEVGKLSVTPVLADSFYNVQPCPSGNTFDRDRASWKKSSVVSWDVSSEVPPSAMGIRHHWGTLTKPVLTEQAHNNLLLKALPIMLEKLKQPDKELGQNEPITYAYEGDLEDNSELDSISNPDAPFDSDIELDTSFLPLALICLPDMSIQRKET